MPAGIAVCQYPETNDSRRSTKPKGGLADCPACGNNVKNLEPPLQTSPSGKKRSKENSASDPPADPRELDVKEFKSADALPTLDLDKMREDMKVLLKMPTFT